MGLSFLAAAPILLLALIFGVSSTKRVSNCKLSGSKKYLILFPLIVIWSKAIVSLPLTVNFTAFKWVFMETSTPIDHDKGKERVTSNCSNNDGAIFKLDCDCLIIELH